MGWNEIMGSGSQSSHLPKRADAARPREGSSTSAAARSGGSRKSATGTAPNSKKRGKGSGSRHIGRKIGLGLLFVFLAVLIAGMGAFLTLYSRLSIPEADDLALAQKTTLYYSDGTTTMGSFGDVNRNIIDTATLPDYVGKAVVASEDRTFYTNSGIDLKGIARALLNNLTTGSRQGGSTLTQQYVERYYVGETTSYLGKAKEAVLAIKINREQSKDEILGNYLNTIYFGRGAYGIEAASQAYFGHPAAQMTLAESAMLAGIIPAPSAWDPAVDEDQARQRFERVLSLMVEDGWISAEDAKAAVFPQTVDPSSQVDESMSGPTGYLIEQVRSELLASGAFTEEAIATGGLKITSTIDKDRQDAAVAAAEMMNSISGWDPKSMHVALSSVDPKTGEIVAEYAGADYLSRQQNGVTQDIAMAGSSFKAFTLLANAENGGSVKDRFSGKSPQYFKGIESAVTNDGGYSFGTVDLVKATSYSINTAFVALNEKVGAHATMETAIKAGIPEDTVGLEPTLLNVLGFAAPHNIDLSTAYSTIANGGSRINAHIVRSVSDSRGNSVYQAPTTSKRAFTVEDVSSIMPALEAVTESDGTAEAVALALPKFTAAGKTGTSQEQRSAQFVGFVPGLVTAVSMYQSDENGNAVPLDNVGGLNQFHGGDWPVDVWISYMKVATGTLTATDFDWKVSTNRKSTSTVEQPQSVPQSGQIGQSGGQAPADQQTQNQPQTPSTDTRPEPDTTNPDTGAGNDSNSGANTNPGGGGNNGSSDAGNSGGGNGGNQNPGTDTGNENRQANPNTR